MTSLNFVESFYFKKVRYARSFNYFYFLIKIRSGMHRNCCIYGLYKLTGDNLLLILKTKEMPKKYPNIKDQGILHSFLGIEVAHSTMGMLFCQYKYMLDLLKEVGMMGCRIAETPMVTNLN